MTFETYIQPCSIMEDWLNNSGSITYIACMVALQQSLLWAVWSQNYTRIKVMVKVWHCNKTSERTGYTIKCPPHYVSTAYHYPPPLTPLAHLIMPPLPTTNLNLSPPLPTSSCLHSLTLTSSFHPSCPPHHAATANLHLSAPLPTSYCHRLTTTTPLPTSYCHCLTTTTLLPTSYCHRLTITTPLPTSYCHRLTTTTPHTSTTYC